MSLKLTTDTTFSGKNLTAEVSLGTFTPAVDCLVIAQIAFTGLNAAAANITLFARIKNGSTEISKVPIGPRAKNATGDTVFGDTLSPVAVDANLTYEILGLSSNASDTSAGGTIGWWDATASAPVDVANIGGYEVSAMGAMVFNTYVGTASAGALESTAGQASTDANTAATQSTAAAASAASADGYAQTAATQSTAAASSAATAAAKNNPLDATGTANAAAAGVLATPANKLATDGTGQVTATNGGLTAADRDQIGAGPRL